MSQGFSHQAAGQQYLMQDCIQGIGCAFTQAGRAFTETGVVFTEIGRMVTEVAPRVGEGSFASHFGGGTGIASQNGGSGGSLKADV
jgi:hypothetical protein